MSHRSKDEADLEVKTRGLDLHTVTAIRMLKYAEPPFEPTKENLKSDIGLAWRESVGFSESVRTLVKNCRYTLNYALNEKAMAKYAAKLGIPAKELCRYGALYLRSKPGLVAWKRTRWALALAHKCAWTSFGRRRRLLGDPMRVQKEGLNHEIQGTVADMMKVTMVALSGIGCRMVLQRHDGWYSAVPAAWSDWERYKAIVEREWEIDQRPITFPAEYEEITHE